MLMKPNRFLLFYDGGAADKARLPVDMIAPEVVRTDHLPLYRRSAMLERDAGVEISRSTMDSR
jgi:hypothetical protein